MRSPCSTLSSAVRSSQSEVSAVEHLEESPPSMGPDNPENPDSGPSPTDGVPIRPIDGPPSVTPTTGARNAELEPERHDVSRSTAPDLDRSANQGPNNTTTVVEQSRAVEVDPGKRLDTVNPPARAAARENDQSTPEGPVVKGFRAGRKSRAAVLRGGQSPDSQDDLSQPGDVAPGLPQPELDTQQNLPTNGPPTTDIPKRGPDKGLTP